MASNKEEYIISLVDKGVSKGLNDVMNQVASLRNKVGGLNQSVGKKGLGGALSSLKGVASTIGLVGLGAAAVQAGRNMIRLTANMEQTRVAFGTFLGSTSEANKLIGELRQFANVTPFETNQVLEASKTLMAFGMGVDETKESMQFLGDISAGTGKDLKELGVIFGQIRGMGRLQGQDLLQLINAGFNPLQIIAEKTGKSMSTLKDEMSKGLISFDMVKDAFKSATSEGGRFYKMMDKQSKTLAGRWSTFIGKLQELMIQIGEALAPLMNAIVDIGLALLEHKKILGTLGITIAIITAGFVFFKIATFAASFSVMGMISSIKLLTAAIASNPIGAIVTAVTLLIIGLVALIRHWDAVTSKLREFGVVGNYIADIMEYIKTGWNNLVNAFKFGGILGILRKIGAVLVQTILSPITFLIKTLARLPGKFGAFFKKASVQMNDFYAEIAGDAENQAAADKAAERQKKLLALRSEAEKARAAYEKSLQVKQQTGIKSSANSNSASLGSTKGGLTAVTSSAPKVFNISIDSLVESMNFETVKDTTQLKDVIRTEVSKLLLGVVNDVQTT